MTVTPIRPEEIADHQETSFPSFVFEEWNRIIAEAAGSSKTFDIRISVPAKRLKFRAQQEMIAYNSIWLDIERIYRKYGWNVKYDSPGYNETYEGFYTFSFAK